MTSWRPCVVVLRRDFFLRIFFVKTPDRRGVCVCVFWNKFVVIPSDRRERRKWVVLAEKKRRRRRGEERVWTSNHTKPSGRRSRSEKMLCDVEKEWPSHNEGES